MGVIFLENCQIFFAPSARKIFRVMLGATAPAQAKSETTCLSAPLLAPPRPHTPWRENEKINGARNTDLLIRIWPFCAPILPIFSSKKGFCPHPKDPQTTCLLSTIYMHFRSFISLKSFTILT